MASIKSLVGFNVWEQFEKSVASYVVQMLLLVVPSGAALAFSIFVGIEVVKSGALQGHFPG